MADNQQTEQVGEQDEARSSQSDAVSRGIWSRRWIRVITYFGVAGLVVMIAAPIIMKHYLQKWLVENGADQAIVEDIDLNPFVGSLRLEGLDVKLNDRTVMGNVDIYVDVGVTSLITRTVTIEKATLDNVQLEIERFADGRTRIGSLVIGESIEAKSATVEAMKQDDEPAARPVESTAGSEASTETDSGGEKSRPWLVNLRELSFTNGEIRYLSPELNTTLAVTSATVDRVYTGISGERGDVKLEGTLDGTPINLVLVFHINPGITVDGTTEVAGLKLEPFAGLLKEQQQTLGGVLTLDGKARFAAGTEQPLSANYDGSLLLADIAVANEELDVSGQSMSWNGAVAFSADEATQSIGVDGKLEGGGLELGMPTQQINLKQSAIRIDGKIEVKLGSELEAKYHGDIALSGTDFGSSDLNAAADEITWKGDVQFASTASEKSGITLDGSLKSAGLKLEMAARQMSVVQSSFSMEGQTGVQLGDALEVSYTGAVILDGSQVNSPAYEINGKSTNWDGAIAFADTGDAEQVVDLDGKLSLDGLSAALPEQAIGASQDQIGLEAKKIKLTLTPDSFDVSGNAALAASTTEVKSTDSGALLLSLASLGVDEVTAESSRRITIPGIELGGLRAGSPQTPDLAVELETLALESVSVADLTDISVGNVRVAKLRALDQAKDLLLAGLEELGISDVQASGAEKASVGKITLSEITLLSNLSDPEQAPVGKIGDTEVSTITYTPEGLTVDTVVVNGLNANLVLEQSGDESREQPADGTAAPSDTTAEDEIDMAVAAELPAAETAGGERFKFSVGELTLAGESLIRVEDRTVTPTMRTALRISELNVKSRDRDQLFGPMDIILDGGIGEYATLKLSGTADPSAMAMDVKVDMEDANMIVLSPYTVKMMGYMVDSGHLSMDSTIKIADGNIDAQNDLFLRELYMNQAEGEIAAAAEAEIGMPVEKAMDMLRDKQGNIKLPVPISGPLAEFKIGLGEIIGKALGSAIKSTTLNYLKFVNPTYGVTVTVIDKIKKEIQKIRIDPVVFEAGKSELPASATESLAKAAAELEKDPDLDVRLCPVSTSEDGTAQGGQASADGAGKEMIDKLILLGHERANGIKRALVTQHNVAAGRLVICVNRQDQEEKAKPRVKFLFGQEKSAVPLL